VINFVEQPFEKYHKKQWFALDYLGGRMNNFVYYWAFEPLEQFVFYRLNSG